jgi:hypothetical protein
MRSIVFLASSLCGPAAFAGNFSLDEKEKAMPII